MTEEKRIYKPRPVTGFPEWLPEERIVEQRWFDNIRRVFESYGYCSIETPSVEEIDVITAKGEVDKEIYVLERLHRDEDSRGEARLALHFDQTVPLARYVAQHFNDLVFPFKRYQMQRVWRGERPQMGRMREFYQCDIDVIGVDNLPLSFDAEVASVIYEAIESLQIGRVQLRINNRKILMGFLDSIDVPTEAGTKKITPDMKVLILREIDKLEKIGREMVCSRIGELGVQHGYPMGLDSLIKPYLEICTRPYSSEEELLEAFQSNKDISSSHPTLQEGIKELGFVLDNLNHIKDKGDDLVIGDLSIVRGLDYYTGTVYETKLLDVPQFIGSVCSGGRYDDLAGSYINKHLPGVGISIGFSRLFDVMRQTHPEKLGVGPKSPADIMMVLLSDTERPFAMQTARMLRQRGLNVEMYHAARKIPDQMKYASKKGIPYVWLPFSEGHQVKNMLTGEQAPANPEEWKKI